MLHLWQKPYKPRLPIPNAVMQHTSDLKTSGQWLQQCIPECDPSQSYFGSKCCNTKQSSCLCSASTQTHSDVLLGLLWARSHVKQPRHCPPVNIMSDLSKSREIDATAHTYRQHTPLCQLLYMPQNQGMRRISCGSCHVCSTSFMQPTCSQTLCALGKKGGTAGDARGGHCSSCCCGGLAGPPQGCTGPGSRSLKWQH
jgi:hypothetical protein